jgi:Tol biopolymer transport system component
MGEVYRARDSRLNRDVAIKTLLAAFADDPNRMARFRREAQALAALSHPNIAAIYGIEEDGGVFALVMEMAEGPTLAERIALGPVPLEESLHIARQITDAIDAAHQKSIIHRDLKPANVKITPEGKVKVLDFGLAKAFDSGPASAGDPVTSPTLTMESTRAGVILGTAAYMSPEQARGKPVDKRADIWSFGVVFYELLTGAKAFEGETISDTLAAVLRADLDWNRLPADTPFGVRRLLQRCLERDPNKRLRDIGDVWNDLDSDENRPAETAVVVAPPSRLRWVPWTIAALAILIAGAIAWEWLRAPEPPRAVTRSSMILPAFAAEPALSRDGTRLAYPQSAGGQPQLTLRMMDQLEGKPIPSAVQGIYPEFSPDGQWIAYFSFPPPFKLKKIPVTGGTSITLCDVPATGHLSWGVDDAIVFGSPKGLMRVSAAGGTPQSLTTVNTNGGESAHSWPEFLPGGQAIVFTIGAGASNLPNDASHVAVLDLKIGASRVLVNAGYAGRYVPTGHLVYLRGGTLFAVPFDLKRLAVTGSETPVVEGINLGDYSFSDSSVLVFKTGSDDIKGSTLEWTDRKGVAQPLPEPARRWGTFAVSPDGKLVAGSILAGSGIPHTDIWIYDVERRTLSRLTFEGSSSRPIWTPDGKWVTFASTREANKSGIYRVAADKSGQPELLLATDAPAYPQSWTPDGKTLLYTEPTEGKNRIWILPPPGGGESKPALFSRTSFNEWNAHVSPDGKWVAYDSDESGRSEVYVVPFPGPGSKFQISTQGGMLPYWPRNGRELFYREPSANQLFAVDVPAGPVFRAGQPQALFKLSGPTPTPMNAAWFDVTPDPKRFLVEQLTEKYATSSGSTFVTITNWFDDLRRRVPVKH